MSSELRNLGRSGEIRSAATLFATAAVASLLGTLLTHRIGGTTAIWPANGLVLGALLLMSGRRSALSFAAVFAGNVLADRLVQDAWSISLVLAACNTLEVTIAALLLRRRLGDPPDLTRPGMLLNFCLLGIVPGPVVSSLAAALLMGVCGHRAPMPIFIHWFYADTLAIAIFTPLILVLRADAAALFRHDRMIETTGVLLLVALVSVGVFAQSRYPLPYLIHAPLMLAVFRLGFPGLMLGIILTLAIALGFTSAGLGPFVLIPGAGITERILNMQFFLATSLLLCFPVATALAQRDRANRELESRASRDGLTGLFNRRQFDATLEREWRRATRLTRPSLSLLMVDVDYFKRFNDRYGHPAGDECLKLVARTLLDMARREDDLVARYGGEEFVLVLPNTPAENAALLAERICRQIEALGIAHAGGVAGVVTVSIGCATSGGARPEGGGLAGPGTLVAEADLALYEAKRLGRNRVVAGPAPRLPE